VAYFISNVITTGYLFYLVPDQNQVDVFLYGFVVISLKLVRDIPKGGDLEGRKKSQTSLPHSTVL
jgi:hypothetical protein